MTKKFVYVAGPMSSSGDYIENIRLGIEIAEIVLQNGGIPFVPQLSALWQLVSPHNEYSYWIPMDLEWLGKCDAFYRIDGESRGADLEEEHAVKLGLPIFYDDVAGLIRYLQRG